MDNEIFQAFCKRIADETDPLVVELFKRRLGLLLAIPPRTESERQPRRESVQ